MNNSDELCHFTQFVNLGHEQSSTTITTTPPCVKIVLGTVVLLSIVWGSVMKFFIYFNISKEKWTEKPINIFTVTEMVKHLLLTSWKQCDLIWRKIATLAYFKIFETLILHWGNC